MQQMQVFITAKLLYMFRVSIDSVAYRPRCQKVVAQIL